MARVIANQEHEVVFQDLIAFLRKHENVSALELLAIASNLVGKIIAMQDQRTVTPEIAMDIVLKNIEIGNQQAQDQLMRTKGSA